MGQSLAGAAVRGMSTATLTNEAQSLLDEGDVTGLMALRRTQFGGFTMMAKDADDNDDPDDEDEDLDDEDDDEDDEDDEDEDDDKSKGKKPSRFERRIQELSAESKKHRLKASQRGKRVRELEAEIANLKQTGAKGKGSKDDEDEDDDKSAEAEEAKRLKKENEALQERVVTQSLRMEFTDLTTGPKPLAQFKNPKKAFRLLDLDDVEIEDDGEIIGLDDAIKALAKSDPYLLVSDKDDDEDEDDEDEVTKRRRRKTGQPTGQRKKGNPNRDKLVSKYPALRR